MDSAPKSLGDVMLAVSRHYDQPLRSVYRKYTGLKKRQRFNVDQEKEFQRGAWVLDHAALLKCIEECQACTRKNLLQALATASIHFHGKGKHDHPFAAPLVEAKKETRATRAANAPSLEVEQKRAAHALRLVALCQEVLEKVCKLPFTRLLALGVLCVTEDIRTLLEEAQTMLARIWLYHFQGRLSFMSAEFGSEMEHCLTLKPDANWVIGTDGEFCRQFSYIEHVHKRAGRAEDEECQVLPKALGEALAAWEPIASFVGYNYKSGSAHRAAHESNDVWNFVYSDEVSDEVRQRHVKSHGAHVFFSTERSTFGRPLVELNPACKQVPEHAPAHVKLLAASEGARQTMSARLIKQTRKLNADLGVTDEDLLAFTGACNQGRGARMTCQKRAWIDTHRDMFTAEHRHTALADDMLNDAANKKVAKDNHSGAAAVEHSYAAGLKRKAPAQ